MIKIILTTTAFISCLLCFDLSAQHKKTVACFIVCDNIEGISEKNIKSIEHSVETSILKKGDYKPLTRNKTYLNIRESIRDYEARGKGNVDSLIITNIGKELQVDFVCWIDVVATDEIHVRLVNVETSVVDQTARGFIENDSLVIKVSTSDFLNDLTITSTSMLTPYPLPESNSPKGYKLPSKLFINIGNGISYGKIAGINVGGRFGGKWAWGFQGGLGAGYDSKETYFHYSGGLKLYYNLIYLNVNYGSTGIKKTEEAGTRNSSDGYINYYKKVEKEYLSGPSLMFGTDYFFGLKSPNKKGYNVNFAFGVVHSDKKLDWAWNIGIGYIIK